jgi:hypothetical protein
MCAQRSQFANAVRNPSGVLTATRSENGAVRTERLKNHVEVYVGTPFQFAADGVLEVTCIVFLY